jgi:chromosomal replication initiator protein
LQTAADTTIFATPSPVEKSENQQAEPPVSQVSVELWNEAVRSIEAMVKPSHRDRWLRPVECVSIRDGRIQLRAPNRYHKEWFEDHFLPSILRDLEARTQRAYTVEFEVVEETPRPVARAAQPQSSADAWDGGAPAVASAALPRLDPVRAPAAPRPELQARYTFDRFVVGPTNRFAHSAARMVADNPGSKWNPLFLYGGSGVGKTHLLQAIGHEIHKIHPEWRIMFVTCEKFVTEFIGSIMNQQRGSQMSDFRSRYRDEPDVLLVDDIQFLSNKDSSQDEFFHTFNALHNAHKQIVLTCDKLPSEVAGLEERLRSRFNWGRIAGMVAPAPETRVAILKRKAELDGVDLPDDVALQLGAAIKTSVRDLEGALARLAAVASFERRPITMDLAQQALKKLVATTTAGLSIETIQREVASYFGVKLAELKGPRRHRTIAQPRMVAMYLARRLTAMSYPEIGSRFGGKDHSTVISAVRKIERLVTEDEALRNVVENLEGRLRDV